MLGDVEELVVLVAHHGGEFCPVYGVLAHSSPSVGIERRFIHHDEVQRYSGTNTPDRRFPYGYRCGASVEPVVKVRCLGKLMPGPGLEEQVWLAIQSFPENPAVFLAETERQGQQSQETLDKIREGITRLERQLQQYAGYRQRAYYRYVRGMTGEETYQRVIAGYKAHEAWLSEDMLRQRQDLERAERQVGDFRAIEGLYPVLCARMENATDLDKRFVLDCLGARVIASSEGTNLELAIPEHVQGTVGTIPGFPAPS